MSAARRNEVTLHPEPKAPIYTLNEARWEPDWFDGQACNVCGQTVDAWGVHTDWGYVHEGCAHVVAADA